MLLRIVRKKTSTWYYIEHPCAISYQHMILQSNVRSKSALFVQIRFTHKQSYFHWCSFHRKNKDLAANPIIAKATFQNNRFSLTHLVPPITIKPLHPHPRIKKPTPSYTWPRKISPTNRSNLSRFAHPHRESKNKHCGQRIHICYSRGRGSRAFPTLYVHQRGCCCCSELLAIGRGRAGRSRERERETRNVPLSAAPRGYEFRYAHLYGVVAPSSQSLSLRGARFVFTISSSHLHSAPCSSALLLGRCGWCWRWDRLIRSWKIWLKYYMIAVGRILDRWRADVFWLEMNWCALWSIFFLPILIVR